MTGKQPVRFGSRENVTVSYHLDRAVAAGSLVRVTADSGPSVRVLNIKSLAACGAPLEKLTHWNTEDIAERYLWYGQSCSAAIFQAQSDMPEGSEVVMELSAALPDETRGNYIYAGTEVSYHLSVVDNADSVKGDRVSGEKSFIIVPGEQDRIEAYLKNDGRTIVTCFDTGGNPVEDGTGPCETLETGKAGRVEVVSGDMKAVSNAVPAAMDGTPVYFGEIHWHSDISCDGRRSLADALTSARDELGLDFCGPADHMWADGRYSEENSVVEQAAICSRFDEPGVFCPFPGAELSYRYGHANIYTDSFETLREIAELLPEKLAPYSDRYTDSYPWDIFTEICPAGRSLLVPHHSNMDSYVVEKVCRPEDGRAWWGPMHWPVPADTKVARIVEMCQNRGAFESEQPQPEWHTLHGGAGGSVRTALAKGYRVGFIGCTDNHNGWPTRLGSGYGGLTAVISGSLDTASVFKALYERRCYATTGARIVADASCNGMPMGSEIKMAPDVTREFKVSIHATSPLVEVQIINWDVPAVSFDVPEGCMDFEKEWTDDRPGRAVQDSYYYVRARQDDGHCCWLSPFWIDAE